MRPTGLAVALALTRGPLPIEAQQAGQRYRMGWRGLGGPTPTTNKLVREPFLSRLKTHGWSEGQDFVMEYRSAPSVEGLAPLAAELVQARVDVIVAANHSAIDAAVQTPRSVPIVRGFDSDPVAMGWVKSLARAGGNIPGRPSIA